MRRNIYEGPSSCYAIREGVYVKGRGVTPETAVGIAYLLLRDLERGWTYDHSCNRIPMTPQLFLQRLRYLYPLCVKHNRESCDLVKALIDYVERHKAIPDWAKHVLERVIVGLEKITLKAKAKVKRGQALPQAW